MVLCMFPNNNSSLQVSPQTGDKAWLITLQWVYNKIYLFGKNIVTNSSVY